MFERFTDDARSVVVIAEEEARRARASRIRPVHILLGVAAAAGPGTRTLGAVGVDPGRLQEAVPATGSGQEDPLDAEALAGLGIDLGRVRDTVEATFGTGALDAEQRPGARAGRPRFADGSKRSLEQALRTALRRGDRRIDTGHVLLGLLAIADPEVTAVLHRLGVDPDELRRRLEADSDAA